MPSLLTASSETCDWLFDASLWLSEILQTLRDCSQTLEKHVRQSVCVQLFQRFERNSLSLGLCLEPSIGFTRRRTTSVRQSRQHWRYSLTTHSGDDLLAKLDPELKECAEMHGEASYCVNPRVSRSHESVIQPRSRRPFPNISTGAGKICGPGTFRTRFSLYLCATIYRQVSCCRSRGHLAF